MLGHPTSVTIVSIMSPADNVLYYIPQSQLLQAAAIVNDNEL